MGYRLALHRTRETAQDGECVKGGKVRLMTVYSQTGNLSLSRPLSMGIISFLSLPVVMVIILTISILSATVNCPCAAWAAWATLFLPCLVPQSVLPSARCFSPSSQPITVSTLTSVQSENSFALKKMPGAALLEAC